MYQRYHVSHSSLLLKDRTRHYSDYINTSNWRNQWFLQFALEKAAIPCTRILLNPRYCSSNLGYHLWHTEMEFWYFKQISLPPFDLNYCDPRCWVFCAIIQIMWFSSTLWAPSSGKRYQGQLQHWKSCWHLFILLRVGESFEISECISHWSLKQSAISLDDVFYIGGHRYSQPLNVDNYNKRD
jgi:hypothetical protein